MFGLSPSELLVVGVVAVLLFGSRLPSVARSMGKSLTEFRRGMSDLQHDFTSAMRDTETAVTKPAEGAQGRLPRAAEVAHDDSLPDDAYDRYDDPEEAETKAEASDAASGDAGEGDPADEAEDRRESAGAPADA